MPDDELLVLIDGHYFAYRFFFGMPALTGPGGRPTGMTFAFADLFRTLHEDPAITHLALVMDHPGKSFRHQIFPEYKAHRDPTPELLARQLPDLLELARVSRVPVVSIPGFEGDDALVALARQAAAGMRVRICTKDKDVDQALSNRISTWDPGSGKLRGPPELLAEKGLRPDQVVDFLCMMGDSSDGVPGIKGVGEITAGKLLTQYGSLDNVLAHLHDFKGARRANLEAFIPQLPLTRRLITIPTEVPGLPELESLRKATGPGPEAQAFYESLGFSLPRFFPQRIRPASADTDYRILTAAELPAVLARAAAAGRCAVDTETTGLDPHSAELVGISLAWGEGSGRSAVYLPLAGREHALATWGEVVGPLQAFLADPAVGKIVQNAKFDRQVFRRHGVELTAVDGDPMLASWLLDPARESHGLDFLTKSFLGEEKIPTAEVLGGAPHMGEVPVAQVARYAAEDAQCTWRLAQALEPRLAQQSLLGPYREQEIPLAACLADMEWEGILVDRTVLEAQAANLERYLTEVDHEIAQLAGHGFNPASPKQVATLLFERLGLPDRHQHSTDASVLESLRHQHQMPGLILQHRELSKLLSSYLRNLPGFINPLTGRIHTHFRQTGTETGRLSSDQPNLQNIPKRSQAGRGIRAAFRARPGCVFLAADYSQIELRVLAHFSGDPALLEAYRRGADIHRFVAAAVHGCDEAAVTPQMRSAAKAVNFGIIYGQSAYGLSQQVPSLDRSAAARFIEDYFKRFAGVKVFIDRTVAEAAQAGFVTTLSGRRRYIPQLASFNRTERMLGQRLALNSCIQGSAADLIKRAMLGCARRLPAGARLLLQVHDDLLIEAEAAVADAAAAVLSESMTSAARLAVPLLAEVHRGADWLEVGA